VLALLRRGPHTVNDLADALELTDNAVRLHLSALERDGLVEQEGVRRGVGKPAHVYRLTSDVEGLFPKAYAAVLADTLALIRDRQGRDELEGLLRTIGQRAGQRSRPKGADLTASAHAAAALLTDLGGLAEVIEADDALIIRGFSCPLAAIVETVPETCALAEELVSAVVGAAAHECCDRSGPSPRCQFKIMR
jgi:predicted ArsR family transcriptional regulator